MSDSKWNPEQYDRFRSERQQPFYDLLGLIRPVPSPRIVDLGCGTGELTAVLHHRLHAAETIGLDRSPTMLAKARPEPANGLRFAEADIGSLDVEGAFDLVFSNAALQWVDDHERLFAGLARLLKRGGQLAVQMPANFDHPAHVSAHRVAAAEPFRAALGGYVRQAPVQRPEDYAVLLDHLGFREQHVRRQVYVHYLPARDDVVEWVKGSLLVDYQERLPPVLFEQFLQRYRAALLPLLDDRRPYFYPFKRLLLWALK